MGLHCSHGAFSGSYSAFNRLRKKALEVIGGSYPPHSGFEGLSETHWYFGHGFATDTHPGLTLFFNHADHRGEFSPQEAFMVATELTEHILMKMPVFRIHGEPSSGLSGEGHIFRAGGYRTALNTFIAGCMRAYANGEPLEFR